MVLGSDGFAHSDSGLLLAAGVAVVSGLGLDLLLHLWWPRGGDEAELQLLVAPRSEYCVRAKREAVEAFLASLRAASASGSASPGSPAE